MSYLTQMAALTVQNFVSAAAGMAVLMALIRGFSRSNVATVGNFWTDLVRGTLYILMPLSVVLALVLVSQGVVQTISPYHEVPLLEPIVTAEEEAVTIQKIAVGPAASQVAIKQLGTNGGGFFNANSAHPLENPTPLSNLLQLVAILLIPAALCYSFGEMVGDRRQGWALLAAMTLIFAVMLAVALFAEHQANPALARLGVDPTPSNLQPGGNMEGKEVRFGVTNSALWAVATTAASNGSVNSMHDSFMPLGGLATMWLMQLGEVVFGGVGSGLYGMIVFAVVAVFLAGLMVGRTPEYLGKKIGAFEIKMASLVILLPCAMVLLGTALGVVAAAGKAGVANPGPHGFSEILYAFSSASNNNGSAFAGLSADTPFYNGLLGLAMLVGRFGVMLPVLAMAGSLARKTHVPAGPGTLPTHTTLFILLLVAVVVVVGALSFFPALALGPVVEHLTLAS
jgi:K+-transporting ATPase ATPase A chain